LISYQGANSETGLFETWDVEATAFLRACGEQKRGAITIRLIRRCAMKSPTQKEDASEFDGPQAPLEMMLIDEYLLSQGFSSIKELCHLPGNEAKRLLIAACRFASLQLAEIESRAKFRTEIHYDEK
jgi:hypothetical protein